MLQAEDIDAQALEVTLAEFGPMESDTADGESTPLDTVDVSAFADSLAAADSNIAAADTVATQTVEEAGLVDGIPIPYNIASDNIITLLLILCLITVVTAFVNSGSKFLRQARSLFEVQRGLTTDEVETSSDVAFLMALAAQACLHLALVFYLYVKTTLADSFALRHYMVIMVFFATIAFFFVIRTLCYKAVEWVFFDKKQCQQWQRANLLLFCIEGLLLLPAVLLWAYFNLPAGAVFTYTLGVIAATKLMAFYKSYLVFFNQPQLLLPNVLFFTALEGTPLVCLWLLLMSISHTMIVQLL